MRFLRSKLAWLLVLVGAIGFAAYGGTVLATPPVGTSSVPLAPVGTFGDINVNTKWGDWKGKIETHGDSDLYVTQVTIQPGGTNGWHMHPGDSFVIVKSGTASFYQGADPTCTPQIIAAGGTIFEPAGVVHTVRNMSTTDPLVNVVVQLIPHGQPRTISMPDPGNCSF
jgi:quercetin dioxygenase-like cupin family protein